MTTTSIPAELQRLRGTFATGKTHPIEWRLQQLGELARMMRDHEADFAEALKADLGKCHFEAVLTEMSFVESEANYARKHLRRWIKPKGLPTPLMALPGRSYAGYPVINDYSLLPVQGDTNQYQPQSMTPPVIEEQVSSTEPRLATVEKIELVYITEDPRNGASAEGGPFYVQPAWRFTGHTNTGQGFEVLVQALDPTYLK